MPVISKREVQRCPECGRKMNPATYKAKDEAPTQQMIWCSNLACKSFGEMIDVNAPDNRAE